MTCSTSSGERRPRRPPRRSVDRVRTWLIFTQDRFGSWAEAISRVSGKPAAGSWLVTAAAITVPERSLKTSSLSTTTGRRPACSRPRTGSRSAQWMWPLSIRAIVPRSAETRQLRLVPRPCPAWRIPERGARGEAVAAFPREHPGSRCFGWGRGRPEPAGPLPSGPEGPKRRRSWRQAWSYGSTKGNTAQPEQRTPRRCGRLAPPHDSRPPDLPHVTL
jgi:hypothetical protein